MGPGISAGHEDRRPEMPQEGAIMSDVTDLIDCYISAWNEGDAECRQKLIARTWTPDAR